LASAETAEGADAVSSPADAASAGVDEGVAVGAVSVEVDAGVDDAPVGAGAARSVVADGLPAAAVAGTGPGDEAAWPDGGDAVWPDGGAGESGPGVGSDGTGAAAAGASAATSTEAEDAATGSIAPQDRQKRRVASLSRPQSGH
jgi:hypothetical protein